MITVHVFGLSLVFWRMHGFPSQRHRWGVAGLEWPTVYLGWVKVISGPRGFGWWWTSVIEIERYVDCPGCGNSGFSGYGTGYGDVCDECGGQSTYAGGVPVTPWWRFW